MSYGQCIECGNDLVAHHGVDGLSIRCGHGERIAELEAEVARLTEEREVLKGWDDEDTTRFARSLAALRALVEKLREAGVTDYHRLQFSSHRVDCHFCRGIWTSGRAANHREGCVLALTEADMLKRLEAK